MLEKKEYNFKVVFLLNTLATLHTRSSTKKHICDWVPYGYIRFLVAC